MRGIMIQGTASDVGKSLITTGLCRLFVQEGVKVTPYKSQNMSNNSYVTVDGKEIGRAQGIQAEAAQTEATAWMNPILLKPRSDVQSEVVLFGKREETLSGRDYREKFYRKGLEAIQSSLDYLEKEFDMVVIEGAGSPAEINLNDRELVNMKVAELADVPVILVADIERGGVFANIIGTLELLTPEERRRVQGLIINKFRGDIGLFQDGVKWLEEKTSIPVLGVLPYIENHQIDGEDSLSIKSQFYMKREKPIDIVVLSLSYISNYSDIEPFLYEEDVSVRFVKEASDFGRPDAVIIPGTKSTIHDLREINDSGLQEQLYNFVEHGGFMVGICGGFQMMGLEIIDQSGSDTGNKGERVKGISFIPARTYFFEEKETIRVKGHYHTNTKLNGNESIEGYEIHLGKTVIIGEEAPFLKLEDGRNEGYYSLDGKIIGTYVHHLFHNDEWRNTWLNEIRKWKHQPIKDVVYTRELKEDRYDRLAFQMKSHLNWEKIKDITYGWDREK
ncbi:cobyric acid synthase [Oceanobacillus bengalensis]|uniref:Cobyric acid synthase n=1 Tax=Oceanobacillus bengalensis TaxID=1435466 RepID=A0A494YTM7_9BACI|nr:cobyric acid synthase [Oceanobacillus bengalensis]RKQ13426.1 cobyric acid synthase [Oceanobacillus bengalensis]